MKIIIIIDKVTRENAVVTTKDPIVIVAEIVAAVVVTEIITTTGEIPTIMLLEEIKTTMKKVLRVSKRVKMK